MPRSIVEKRSRKLTKAPGVVGRLVDSIFEAVSPIRAEARYASRARMASSWWSTDKNRRGMRSLAPSDGSATTDVNEHLEELRSQSRHMIRNNPIGAGVVSTKVLNVISTGLTLHSSPDADLLGCTQEASSELSKSFERAWRYHSNSLDFDITRRKDATALSRLAYNSLLASGDTVLIRRARDRGGMFRTAWQIIEGDRLSNPSNAIDGLPNPNKPDGSNKIYGGVEWDDDGAAVAYWIRRDHPGALVYDGATTWDRIPARDAMDLPVVIHLYKDDRPGQSRGYPDLSPVIETIHKTGRVADSTVDKALTAAFLALSIESETGMGLATGNASLESLEDDATDDEVVIDKNTVFYLRHGETAKVIESNHPGTSYDPFMTFMARYIGMATGLPYEVLMKHFQSSYSAARAALLDAWAYFMADRHWLSGQLMSPWYKTTIYEAVERGHVVIPGFLSSSIVRDAALLHSWTGAAMPQIDPTKAVKAARDRVEGRFSTYSDETAGLVGKDWEETMTRRSREEQLLDELGIGRPDGDPAPVPLQMEEEPPPNKEDEEEAREE